MPRQQKPQKRKGSAKDESIPSTTLTPSSTTVSLRSRKIRFSSTSPPPTSTHTTITEAKKPDLQEETNTDNNNLPPPLAAEEAEAATNGKIDADADSDDDAAPEAVSLATSAAQSRSRGVGAARAARSQAEKDKKRRRERDERLKEQATERSSKKRKKAKGKEAVAEDDVNQVEEEDDDEEEEEEAFEGLHDVDGKLPTFLPQSLLDAIPEREETPDVEMLPRKKLKVRNIHEYGGIVKRPLDRKSKDLTVGSLSVSVLEKKNKFLPPTVVQKAKGVRENWLRGRPTMAALARKRSKGTRSRGGRMERRVWGGARVFS